MIKNLTVKNIGIIKEGFLEFKEGLNIITGASGSGKSLILEALNLLRGARSDKSLISQGADFLQIDAEFALSSDMIKSVEDFLSSEDIDSFIVSRRVLKNGVSKNYINGIPVSLRRLKEIVGNLISFCGQKEASKLLDPNFQLDILDAFADNNNILSKYREVYQRFNKEKKELDLLKDKEKNLRLKQAQLQFIVDELLSADIYCGKEEELREKIKHYQFSEKIISTAQSIILSLSQGDINIIDTLSEVKVSSGKLAELDNRFSSIETLFVEAKGLLDEADYQLNKIVSSIEVNDNELNRLRDDLHNYLSLMRKYGEDERGLIALLERSQRELGEIEDIDSIKKKKEENVKKYLNNVLTAGKKISKRREQAAQELACKLEKELKDVGLNNVEFSVVFNKEDEPSLQGLERIDFFISTNKGEKIKPLNLVASGGELSRITLTLKNLISFKKDTSLLVFDEVDTGLSGKEAQEVGVKLSSLAKRAQIVCITHLPQVAAFASNHLLIEKHTTDTGVETKIKRLSSKKEQSLEIARMLGGKDITDAAKEAALELLAS